jgi:DMSO/TMAO reductase YedYZ molybdopterin-dependent catalytic subunit
MDSKTGLPPGQREAQLDRFGLPRFARVRPRSPAAPVLLVTGAVLRPVQLPLAELADRVPRVTRAGDLHCVTTWSARDLTWAGMPFRAVHEHLAALVGLDPAARWVTFTGLDAYRACLRLDDALAPGVLLADTLAGCPLTPDRGAPLRLVAPEHYGYKQVKHVCVIEYGRAYDAGSARWAGHRRGRVAREERSRYLPGWAWRPVWRALQPGVRRRYTRDNSAA